MSTRKVYVLDTSAIIEGYGMQFKAEHWIPPEVFNEVLGRWPKTLLELMISIGRIRVKEPDEDSLKIVKEAARKTGDLQALSKADIASLALTLALKKMRRNPTLLTDDYSIQNVAESLKIKYASLASKGIRYKFNWLHYCPACKAKYSREEGLTICKVCGSTLKRKVLRKAKVLRKHGG